MPPVPAAVATPANTAVPVTTPAAAPKNGATTPTQPPAPAAETPKFKVKVNGEVREFSQQEAERLLSKSDYAYSTLQKAKEALARVAKEDEERKAREAAWDDDEKLERMLRERIGEERYDKLTRKRLQAKVAEQEMTPEQRAIAERDAEIQRLKKADEARAAKEAQAKQAEANRYIQKQMETQLAAAAEKAGFSMDPDSFWAIYETVKDWARLGLPWNAERIVETAMENIDGGFKRLEQSVLKSLKGQALEDRLGKAIVDELIRHRAEKLRNGGRPAPIAQQQAQKPPAQQQYLSPQDLQEKYRGGR